MRAVAYPTSVRHFKELFHDSLYTPPSWRSLIHYLCTSQISFNRLRSQSNVAAPLPAPKKSAAEELALPPSCSPKSMYRLAHRVSPSLQPVLNPVMSILSDVIQAGT